MKLRQIDFEGYFEEQPGQACEHLQVLEPENELEEILIAWAILPHAEVVDEDSARRGYVFQYEVGEHLSNGLYQLRVRAEDASGVAWWAELAAALVTTAPSAAGRRQGFAPFWFLSKRLHFKASNQSVAEKYGSTAYGELTFTRAGSLPHRRLFLAA